MTDCTSRTSYCIIAVQNGYKLLKSPSKNNTLRLLTFGVNCDSIMYRCLVHHRISSTDIGRRTNEAYPVDSLAPLWGDRKGQLYISVVSKLEAGCQQGFSRKRGKDSLVLTS